MNRLDQLLELIKNNPVRIYGIIVALLPVLAIFITGLPVAPLLVLAAAVLGISEVPRQLVTPVRKLDPEA